MHQHASNPITRLTPTNKSKCRSSVVLQLCFMYCTGHRACSARTASESAGPWERQNAISFFLQRTSLTSATPKSATHFIHLPTTDDGTHQRESSYWLPVWTLPPSIPSTIHFMASKQPASWRHFAAGLTCLPSPLLSTPELSCGFPSSLVRSAEWQNRRQESKYSSTTFCPFKVALHMQLHTRSL